MKKNIYRNKLRSAKKNYSFILPNLVIQTKLEIGASDDRYEKEADRMADKVVSKSTAEVSHKPQTRPIVQKKCSTCDEEKHLQKKPLSEQITPLVQRKTTVLNGGSVASSDVSSKISQSKGGGRPLGKDTQNAMESGFGTDFSNVRVHTDTNAANLSRELNAQAFTVGNDIYFNEGKYNPNSNSGKHLLAHELTHTVQQSKQSIRVQRMKYGQQNPPRFGGDKLEIIPEDEKLLIDKAILLIKKIAHNPEDSRACHDFFKNNCPKGKSSTLKDIFDNALLWKLPAHISTSAGAISNVGKDDIAITKFGLSSKNPNTLAGFLIHELMHNCGVTSGTTNHDTISDKARLYCISRGENQFSLHAGIDLQSNALAIFAYRRFISEWHAGKLKTSVGADFNIAGIEKGELFSIMGGLSRRSNVLWGGEQFGGFNFSSEVGIGIGKFRNATANEVSSLGYKPVAILQLKMGAEFAIPDIFHGFRDGRRDSITLEAGIRLAQPINKEARTIKALTFGISKTF